MKHAERIGIALVILGAVQMLAAGWWGAWLGAHQAAPGVGAYPTALGIQGLVCAFAGSFLWMEG